MKSETLLFLVVAGLALWALWSFTRPQPTTQVAPLGASPVVLPASQSGLNGLVGPVLNTGVNVYLSSIL